jgi:lycopene cyclase domain-containing protein
MNNLYLLINLGTISIPLLFSFHPKLLFYKNWKVFFLGNSIVAFLFCVWDMYFTKLGVWGFNSQYITGIHIGNLPVEEVLFFLCIPFACVYTYHCLTLFFTFTWKKSTENWVTSTLASVLFFFGVYFHSNYYTSYTFISLSILLLILHYLLHVNWLSKALSVYAVLLIPFCIVNGILTGFGLEDPVVWYNSNEIIGIRLITIPIEDVFYGLELFLLNIYFYTIIKDRLIKKHAAYE